MLPKLCNRNNFPISYGKFRIELFVKFNSRSVIKSPISDGRFLNLLFDKSSVTRLLKQAISDGNRVN